MGFIWSWMGKARVHSWMWVETTVFGFWQALWLHLLYVLILGYPKAVFLFVCLFVLIVTLQLTINLPRSLFPSHHCRKTSLALQRSLKQPGSQCESESPASPVPSCNVCHNEASCPCFHCYLCAWPMLAPTSVPLHPWRMLCFILSRDCEYNISFLHDSLLHVYMSF